MKTIIYYISFQLCLFFSSYVYDRSWYLRYYIKYYIALYINILSLYSYFLCEYPHTTNYIIYFDCSAIHDSLYTVCKTIIIIIIFIFIYYHYYYYYGIVVFNNLCAYPTIIVYLYIISVLNMICLCILLNVI